MGTKLKVEIRKGAIINGVVNGLINGGLQYFFLKDKAPIAISVDTITNNVETVLGAAVTLGISLAVIATVITYFTIKEEKVPFFPKAFLSVFKHGFFTFGVITSLAVIWQRYMGTIEVGLYMAIIIIALIAGAVAGIVNYLTIKACVVDNNERIIEK